MSSFYDDSWKNTECIPISVKGNMRAWYTSTYGVLSSDVLVLHKCDVSNCRNIQHIWLGSYSDNMRDCAEKGRVRGGCAGVVKDEIWRAAICEGKSVLTLKQVLYIRSSLKSIAELANELNVHRLAVSRAKKYETWRHLK
jgi:hypothetical protein